MTGYPDIVESAFVSSKVHPFLKYLATPLLIGPNGIIKNLGLPKFSDFEQCMFDNAVPVLAHDIKKGLQFNQKLYLKISTKIEIFRRKVSWNLRSATTL